MSLISLVPLPELPPKSPKKKLGPKFNPTSHLTFSPNSNACEYDLEMMVKQISSSMACLCPQTCVKMVSLEIRFSLSIDNGYWAG